MIYHPEMTLDGQIGRRGRCEYSYIFFEASMLLLIELKLDLKSMTDHHFSNIIGQVVAEADGRASSFFFLLSNA